MTQEQEAICDKIVGFYTWDILKFKAGEELGELLQALNRMCYEGACHALDKLEKPYNNSTLREHILEEVSDTMICLHYIVKGCNISYEDIEKAIDSKLKRQLERMKTVGYKEPYR